MKKEELRDSFDRIRPDEAAKRRMLDNILNQYERKKRIYMPFGLQRAVPALAVVVIIAGGLLTFNLAGRYNNNLSNGNKPGVADYSRDVQEDAVAPLLNQFQFGNRYYILLTDDLRKDFGLPSSIDESDIGEKIGDITASVDSSLIGVEIYSYIPAGCEAVVAVKKDNEYRLFRFFSFESYNRNQDEDAAEYLKLFGIKTSDDIAKIQFIGYSEQGKIQGYTDIIAELTGRDEIADFYKFYSVLKNSSDKYFETLFNFRSQYTGDVEVDYAVPDNMDPELTAPDRTGGAADVMHDIITERERMAEDLPLATDGNSSSVRSADTPVTDRPSSPGYPNMVDTGNTGSGEVQPSQGSAGYALENWVTIRIYNRKGIFYDSPYYRNIGFISRYEVNEEFREILEGYIK